MQHGADLLRALLDAGWPEGVVINVNYPNCEPSAVKGATATMQGLRDPGLLRIEDRFDTRGRAYYWVGIERRRAEPPKGTDLWAVRSNSDFGNAALSRLYGPESARKACDSTR